MPDVRFEVRCPGAERVFIAGDFNNWDPSARRMKRVRRGEDVFIARLGLEAGRYEFKYVVDGEWCCCPCAEKVPNAVGDENSVIEVCEE